MPNRKRMKNGDFARLGLFTAMSVFFGMKNKDLEEYAVKRPARKGHGRKTHGASGEGRAGFKLIKKMARRIPTPRTRVMVNQGRKS